MHIYELSFGFLGTNGIVGASIPLGAGAALGAQLRGSTQLAVSFFGDGAVNNCAFHEGINMAAIWNLPVVFVCENNLYATETPFEKVTRNTDIASRGAAYSIPGVGVDGNDVLAVYEVGREAAARARAGGGPTLIECKTYRTVGHFEGTLESATAPKKKSPNGKARSDRPAAKASSGEGACKSGGAGHHQGEAEAEVEAAYEYARSSPEPVPSTVTDFVYAD